MSKFNSSFAELDGDGKPKIFSKFAEITALSDEKWSEAVSKAAGGEVHFPDGSEWTLLGLVTREGTYTNDDGKSSEFCYIAIYLQDVDNKDNLQFYSVRALTAKKRDFSQTPSFIVERPKDALTYNDVEKWINKKVKVVRTPFTAKYPNGRLNEDAVMISFVKVA